MITLQVNDFGPIADSGMVKLKPLTVFVGPNNSGKSYLAVLAYAIFRSLPPFYHIARFFRWQRRTPSPQLFFPTLDEHVEAELLDNKEVIESLRDWSRHITEKGEGREGGEIAISMDQLPEIVRQTFNKAFQSSINAYVTAFIEELQRCYASEISDLTRKAAKKRFSISVDQDSPPLRLNMSCVDNKLKLDDSPFDMSNLSVRLPFRRWQRTLRQQEDIDVNVRFILSELLESFLITAYKEFQVDPYYLPAARSGILLGHRGLSSRVMRRAPLAGIMDLQIPKFPGVVADFVGEVLDLQEVLALQKKRPTKLSNIATFLEKNVTQGAVDIEAGRLEYPEIFYDQPDSGKFPLHRTSSMVSELAPLVLFLKYIIDPGDFLILEEPESHLHPASQRKLARVIVKLVRNGVKVLITTHSDYFVEQLNHFIMLSQASDEERIGRGYSAEDYLKPEEVGAFLFKISRRKRGSIVSPLKISLKEGITSDEFGRVVDELHEETIQVERIITR